MTDAVQAEVAEARRRLEESKDPRAKRPPTPHPVLGVGDAALEAFARTLHKRHPGDKGYAHLRALAAALWGGSSHEEKALALKLLQPHARRFRNEDWKGLKAWLSAARAADLCDAIAVDLLGALVRRDREWCAVLRHWARSPDPWERRGALRAMTLRVRQMGDLDAGFGVLAPLFEDADPIVREAVVDLLREARSADGPRFEEFLASRAALPAAILKAIEAPAGTGSIGRRRPGRRRN